jgi:hypothetical protein
VVVDNEGFAEISAILTKALDDVSAAEERSTKRLSRADHDEIRATVVAMLFESAPPDATDGGVPIDGEPHRRKRRTTRTKARSSAET